MRTPAVSVIVTAKNEAGNIRHLLDSLVPQAHLHEVILVDAESRDATADIARAYTARLPIQVLVQDCRRGEGRNIGARRATGQLLAFIDGDCIANARWLEELVDAWKSEDTQGQDHVVAGQTILIGYWAFTRLHRVELPHKGKDTTWPSCNLLYPRDLFARLGGFDESFVTAEDIDLNYRAIEAGAHITHAQEAIVYARARESITGFLSQAYWNGFGRKQLTQKHGRLWHQYNLLQLLKAQGGSAWGVLRMAWGFVGYMAAKAGVRP